MQCGVMLTCKVPPTHDLKTVLESKQRFSCCVLVTDGDIVLHTKSFLALRATPCRRWRSTGSDLTQLYLRRHFIDKSICEVSSVKWETTIHRKFLWRKLISWNQNHFVWCAHFPTTHDWFNAVVLILFSYSSRTNWNTVNTSPTKIKKKRITKISLYLLWRNYRLLWTKQTLL